MPGSDKKKCEEKKKDRKPYCGKCRNHGIIQLLKGHKKSCKYQHCMCEVCILGVMRRDVNKELNVLKKQKKIKGQITTPYLFDATPLSPASTISTNSLPSSPLDDIKGFKSPPISSRLSELEKFSHSADKLVNSYGLDYKALPFAYAILTVAGCFDNAVKKIKEASNYMAEMGLSLDSDTVITSSNDVEIPHRIFRPTLVSHPGFNPSGVIRNSADVSVNIVTSDNIPKNSVYPRPKNRFNF